MISVETGAPVLLQPWEVIGNPLRRQECPRYRRSAQGVKRRDGVASGKRLHNLTEHQHAIHG